VAFISVAVLGSISGTIYFYLQSNEIIKQNAFNHLETTAQSRAKHVETYLKQNIERLKLITSKTWLRQNLKVYKENPDEEIKSNITQIIADAKKSIEEFERVCVVGLDGIIITSTDKDFCYKDVRTKNFFISGRKGNKIYFVEEDGKQKIFVSGPFILDGELVGVGITVVSIDVLKNIVKDRIGLGETGEVLVTTQGKNERIYLFKRLFEQEAISQDIESAETAEPMKQALAGNEMIFENTLDYRDEEVIAVSQYIEIGNIGLVAKIDRAEILGAARNKLIKTSLIIIIFISIIVSLVGLYIARKVTKPIIALYRGTEIIEKGNLNYKVGTNSKDEIGQLSRAFDKMTATIKKSRAEVDRKVEDQTKEIFSKQKDLENQQKAVLNILEDVEAEKENVAKERDKIDAILHSIGDGVFVVDIDLKITVFNQIAADLCGYNVEEAVGKKYDKVLEFVYEKDGKTNDKFIKEAMATGKIKEMSNHTNLIRKDGSKIAVADSAAPLVDRDGKVIGCVVVFRDVTKEREVDKMKTEFVSLASHQLRTPLSAIKWFLEMVLVGDAGKINEEQRDFLQQAFDSNERMVKLVNNLLNVSRIETGRLALEPKPTDLIKLATDAVKELTPLIKAHNKQFKFIKPKTLPKINIDSKLVFQVIANLLSNAIKYTEHKGKIELKIELMKTEILITVQDDGIGIPKEQQQKVFQKLFRADNVVAKDTEGTGLGLYVAKSVVESSGGKIGFRSELGKGSTFWFTLPLSGSKKIKGEKSLESLKV